MTDITKRENLEIKYVPVGDLIPAEYNPRKADKKEYQDLKNSLEEFGFVDPLVVNRAPGRENVIIGGHFRLRVAMDMGYKKVPATYVTITDLKKEQELNIRLNKNTGSFDYDLLANFDEDFLRGAGFESAELDRIFQTENRPEDDELPEPRKTDIKPGDIFQLGEHRLLCGDAMILGSMRRLMGQESAQMVFTDPPYNIDYTGGMNAFGQNLREGIKNDNLEEGAFRALLHESIKTAMEVCEGAFYICMASVQLHELREQFIKAGGHFQSYIIWVKSHFTYIGRMDYQHQYEPILYGWNGNSKNHYFIDDRSQADVWEDLRDIKTEYNGEYTSIRFQGFEVRIMGRAEGTVRKKQFKTDIWRFDKPSRSEEHPTMKPVAMVKKAIENSSHRGAIVLDPFGGSGSTMIAAEKAGRRCRMMELDPLFCQVIIDRWEKFTGGKAEPKTEPIEAAG